MALFLRAGRARCARPVAAPWPVLARHNAPAVRVRVLTGASGAPEQEQRPRAEAAAAAAAVGKLVYEGALTRTMRNIKRLSLTSCVGSLIGAPVLAFFGSPEVPLLQRAAIGVAVIALGVGTTMALNTFTRLYVTRIWLLPATGPHDRVRIETLNVWSRPVVTEAKLEELTLRGLRPGGSFQCQGRSFFVHEEQVVSNLALKPYLGHVLDFERDSAPPKEDAAASSVATAASPLAQQPTQGKDGTQPQPPQKE